MNNPLVKVKVSSFWVSKNKKITHYDHVLQFDKIKFISSIKDIQIVNENSFKTILREGVIVEQKISMTSPHSLKIKCDYLNQELVVEFTAKILKDDYVNLITFDNFDQCLQRINDLGVCRLDIDSVFNTGYIVKADATKDIYLPGWKRWAQTIKSNIANYNKYLCRTMSNGNVIIENNVTTKQYKKRVTFYDKYKEVTLLKNKDFLNSLTNSEALIDYFKDKVRIERNLNSKEQIRKALNIPDTDIKTVLTSNANPLKDFVDEVFADEGVSRVASCKQEYFIKLALKDHGFDLAKTEATMRELYSNGTNISKVMKPFRTLLQKMNEEGASSIKSKLMSLL